MKLYIKQAVLTLGERFTVWNEYQEAAYTVEGNFLRIPKQFRIYDAYGKQVAQIERQLFRILPKYNITTNTHHVTLDQHLSFLTHRFSIQGLNWVVEGDFTAHNYLFKENGEIIMRMRKRWFTIGDAYEIEINKKENEVLALALVIAIDHVILKESANN